MREAWQQMSTSERNEMRKKMQKASTSDERNEIRQKYSTRNYSTYKLAKEYDVSQHCICDIIQNKTWIDKNFIYSLDSKNLCIISLSVNSLTKSSNTINNSSLDQKLLIAGKLNPRF